MCNERKTYVDVKEILEECKTYLIKENQFDVITIVGEGEPTLYSEIGILIKGIKKLTVKPVAVITNGSLLSDTDLSLQLNEADIILPSLDAYDQESYEKINRPYGQLRFDKVFKGLKEFASSYKGEVWVETMLIHNLNDDMNSLSKLRYLLDQVSYDRLYLNTPVRPPAESWVKEPTAESLALAVEILKGISIDSLTSGTFFSEEENDLDALLSIIKRHPMNQHEIKSLLQSRFSADVQGTIRRLEMDTRIEKINYKGYITYRMIKDCDSF